MKNVSNFNLQIITLKEASVSIRDLQPELSSALENIALNKNYNYYKDVYRYGETSWLFMLSVIVMVSSWRRVGTVSYLCFLNTFPFSDILIITTTYTGAVEFLNLAYFG